MLRLLKERYIVAWSDLCIVLSKLGHNGTDKTHEVAAILSMFLVLTGMALFTE